MKVLPRLFKMDSRKKIRKWDIIACDGDIPYYTVEHGLLDGQTVSSSTIIKEGKNVGRSNETTAYEQCVSEAKSLWAKQRDRKGYSETIPTEVPHRPMLAQSYDKHSKKIKFPAYISIKYDGLRCLANKDGLISRQGKKFNAIPHIENAVKDIVGDTGLTLDGELYVHSESFQEICSAVKRDKPSDKSSHIQYHVYDLISDEDYEVRLNKLRKLLVKHSDIIKLVDSTEIGGPNEIDIYWKKFTKDGYEGAMLRNKKGPYKINGRSENLQKYKKFIDEEFEVIGAHENRGKLVGTCVFELKTKDGAKFDAMPEGTEEVRRQYWKDWNSKVIKQGDLATVKFFRWSTTKEPKPIFPILKIIRNFE